MNFQKPIDFSIEIWYNVYRTEENRKPQRTVEREIKTMKAWRVRTGFNTDYYGQPDGEKAEYFFDEEKARARYEEGAVYLTQTKITTTYADGTVSVSYAHKIRYEQCLKEAKPNEKVELVKGNKMYRFKLEENEIN